MPLSSGNNLHSIDFPSSVIDTRCEFFGCLFCSFLLQFFSGSFFLFCKGQAKEQGLNLIQEGIELKKKLGGPLYLAAGHCDLGSKYHVLFSFIITFPHFCIHEVVALFEKKRVLAVTETTLATRFERKVRRCRASTGIDFTKFRESKTQEQPRRDEDRLGTAIGDLTSDS